MVKLFKTKVFTNSQGSVVKIISKDQNIIKKAKEVYISSVNKKFKDWRLHKDMNCFLIVLGGAIELQWIEREKIKKKIFYNDLKNIIFIKCKIFFRFKGLRSNNFLINFADRFHDNKEIIRKKKY